MQVEKDGINPTALREMMTVHDIHCYCDTNDVLYANKNYITFHASHGGEKIIKLPRKATVAEVYDGETYAESSSEIRFKIKRGETKMFRLIEEE